MYSINRVANTQTNQSLLIYSISRSSSFLIQWPLDITRLLQQHVHGRNVRQFRGSKELNRSQIPEAVVNGPVISTFQKIRELLAIFHIHKGLLDHRLGFPVSNLNVQQHGDGNST